MFNGLKQRLENLFRNPLKTFNKAKLMATASSILTTSSDQPDESNSPGHPEADGNVQRTFEGGANDGTHFPQSVYDTWGTDFFKRGEGGNPPGYFAAGSEDGMIHDTPYGEKTSFTVQGRGGMTIAMADMGGIHEKIGKIAEQLRAKLEKEGLDANVTIDPPTDGISLQHEAYLRGKQTLQDMRAIMRTNPNPWIVGDSDHILRDHKMPEFVAKGLTVEFAKYLSTKAPGGVVLIHQNEGSAVMIDAFQNAAPATTTEKPNQNDNLKTELVEGETADEDDNLKTELVQGETMDEQISYDNLKPEGEQPEEINIDARYGPVF